MQRQSSSEQHNESLNLFSQGQTMTQDWEKSVTKEAQRISEQRKFQRFEPNETLCAVKSDSNDSFGLIKNISFGGMFVTLAGTCNNINMLKECKFDIFRLNSQLSAHQISCIIEREGLHSPDSPSPFNANIACKTLALRFIDLSEEDINALHYLIHSQP